MARIVVTLGENALGKTPFEQREILKLTAKYLLELIKRGDEIVVSYGSEEQVGSINLAFDLSSLNDSQMYRLPIAETVAMAQGYVGFQLQQALKNELLRQKINKNIISVMTTTIVNANDEAFKYPSRPIGIFYSQAQAKKLAKTNNWTVAETENNYWRRVVASPVPIGFIETQAINSLVNSGFIVLAAGAGGVPVIYNKNTYITCEAVVDKDLAAAKLAKLIDANQLIILTGIDQVKLNFDQANQKGLKTLTTMQAQKYLQAHQFGPETMAPKIKAAITFLNQNYGRSVLIGALNQTASLIAGLSGTKIIS